MGDYNGKNILDNFRQNNLNISVFFQMTDNAVVVRNVKIKMAN